MAKLIMTRGLPGSGKSTWAKTQKGFVVIEKDQIRAEFEQTGWKWSRENEKDILARQAQMISQALRAGQDVIAADTNFGKHEARLKSIADQAGAEFAVRDFTEVDVRLCVERNANRENPVPEEAIMDMYRKYVEPSLKVVPYDNPRDLPWAIVCDLDGTLALHRGRSPYEEEKCDTDEFNYPVLMILKTFQQSGVKIIFVSGRQDKGEVRAKTRAWLDREERLAGADLLMRKGGDLRNDAVVKNDIFDEHIRGKYHVMFVLDDRDRVVKRWRELGLTCLQVNYGNF